MRIIYELAFTQATYKAVLRKDQFKTFDQLCSWNLNLLLINTCTNICTKNCCKKQHRTAINAIQQDPSKHTHASMQR